jgi:hypothetical protein
MDFLPKLTASGATTVDAFDHTWIAKVSRCDVPLQDGHAKLILIKLDQTIH